MSYLIHILFILLQVLILLKFKKEILFVISDKLDFSKLEKRDMLSSDVMLLYVDILENPGNYSCSEYTLSSSRSEIRVWATNTIEYRGFYTHNNDLKSQVEEMNAKLTKYDKLLLDKICTRVKNQQVHLMNTFFDA